MRMKTTNSAQRQLTAMFKKRHICSQSPLSCRQTCALKTCSGYTPIPAPVPPAALSIQAESPADSLPARGQEPQKNRNQISIQNDSGGICHCKSFLGQTAPEIRMKRKNKKTRMAGDAKRPNHASGEGNGHDMRQDFAFWSAKGMFSKESEAGAGNGHTTLHFPKDNLSVMLCGIGIPSVVFHRPYGLLRLFPQIEKLIVRQKLQLERGGTQFLRKRGYRRKYRGHETSPVKVIVHNMHIISKRQAFLPPFPGSAGLSER